MSRARVCTLAQILAEAEGPVTVAQLARQLGVSKRTVRSDLSELEIQLNRLGARLERRPRVGVRALNLTPEVVEAVAQGEAAPSLASRVGREHWLLCRLLTGQGLSQSEARRQLFVSRSTLQRHLQSVEAWLQRHNLTLLRERGMLAVQGTEVAIRQALVDLLLHECQREGITPPQIWDRVLRGSKPTEDVAAKVERIINQALAKLPYSVTDSSKEALILHALVLVVRLQKGRALGTLPLPLGSLRNTKEFEVAVWIAEQLAASCGVRVPDEEIGYVALRLLAAKINPGGPPCSALDCSQFGIDPIYTDLARGFARVAGEILSLPLEDDEELLIALALHLQPAIQRLRCGFAVRNPVLAMIRERYPLLYYVATTAAHYLEKQTGLVIPPEELGYLAAHIGAAVERRKPRPARISVLLVCPSGVGTAEFLRTSVARRFPEIEIVGTAAIDTAAEWARTRGAGLVISTVPLAIEGVDVITVNPVLSPADIHRIAEAIRRLERIPPLTRAAPSRSSEGEVPYMLEDVLSPDTIRLDLEAADWEEAVTLAGQPLVEHGFVEPRYISGMIKMVRDAGPYMVVGPGIAIPHARPEEGVLRVGVSFVRLRRPVTFPGKPHNPVDLIFALAAEDNYRHISVMAKLATILSNPELVDVLRTARDAEEIMTMVRNVQIPEDL